MDGFHLYSQVSVRSRHKVPALNTAGTLLYLWRGFNIQPRASTTPSRGSGGATPPKVPGVTQTVTCMGSITGNVILKASALAWCFSLRWFSFRFATLRSLIPPSSRRRRLKRPLSAPAARQCELFSDISTQSIYCFG